MSIALFLLPACLRCTALQAALDTAQHVDDSYTGCCPLPPCMLFCYCYAICSLLHCTACRCRYRYIHVLGPPAEQLNMMPPSTLVTLTALVHFHAVYPSMELPRCLCLIVSGLQYLPSVLSLPLPVLVSLLVLVPPSPANVMTLIAPPRPKATRPCMTPSHSHLPRFPVSPRMQRQL